MDRVRCQTQRQELIGFLLILIELTYVLGAADRLGDFD